MNPAPKQRRGRGGWCGGCGGAQPGLQLPAVDRVGRGRCRAERHSESYFQQQQQQRRGRHWQRQQAAVQAEFPVAPHGEAAQAPALPPLEKSFWWRACVGVKFVRKAYWQ